MAAIALGGVVALAGCARAGARSGPAASDEAAVAVWPRGARITVPLSTSSARTWEWYAGRTTDNELEYEWAVRVAAPGGAYRVGYQLFKFPGTAPRAGAFDALLQAGQVGIDREGMFEGQSVARATEYRLQARVDGDRLTFELADSAAVAAVFAARPQVVTLRRLIAGRRLAERRIRVLYQPAAPGA